MFHKGLTFVKRKSTLKQLKDLYGIWFVTTQLGGFSEDAILEFQSLIKKHSKWYQTFIKNCRLWIDSTSP
ncbi:MAG: hypothetical protein P0S95_00425 [Rhabdochlamydiaceae bacterium]|nr:hypothetical protein [Candidatus Amphrikana amoebophyrae]